MENSSSAVKLTFQAFSSSQMLIISRRNVSLYIYNPPHTHTNCFSRVLACLYGPCSVTNATQPSVYRHAHDCTTRFAHLLAPHMHMAVLMATTWPSLLLYTSQDKQPVTSPADLSIFPLVVPTLFFSSVYTQLPFSYFSPPSTTSICACHFFPRS
jgi:hypothetical protein